MDHIHHLLFIVALVLLSAPLVVGTSNYYCPKVSYPAQQVSCWTFGETTDCFDKCCKYNGKCYGNTCSANFGVTDTNTMCSSSACTSEVKCVLYKSKTPCTSTPGNYNCLGFTQCIKPHCGGFAPNSACLSDTKTTSFRVCCVDGGGVVGDPQFTGLRGQDYQVHGVSGYIYNIISDNDLQYNARFVFLDSGECPEIDGQNVTGCWTHPGTYLGELGLKTQYGERIHVKTGSAKTGFEEITIDGRPVKIGQTVTLAEDGGFVTRNSTHVASMTIGNWQLVFENSDYYLNQRVNVLDTEELKTAHGMLGQTWRGKIYKNAIKYIEGVVDDYVIREKNVFGDDFTFNVYTPVAVPKDTHPTTISTVILE